MANPTAVFIEGNVQRPMQLVLNVPVRIKAAKSAAHSDGSDSCAELTPGHFSSSRRVVPDHSVSKASKNASRDGAGCPGLVGRGGDGGTGVSRRSLAVISLELPHDEPRFASTIPARQLRGALTPSSETTVLAGSWNLIRGACAASSHLAPTSPPTMCRRERGLAGL